MKRILLICILFVGKFAYAQKISYIKMERTPCFGKCPSYSIEFFKDGKIIYNGKKDADRSGIYSAKISVKQMASFLKQCGRYKISSLPSEYKTIARDLSHLNLNFIIKGNDKRIKNAENGPAYLSGIARMMDNKIRGLQWVKVADYEENGGDGEVIVVPAPGKQTYTPPREGPAEVAPIGNNSEEVLNFAEQMPEYPGGTEELNRFLSQNLKYPEIARERGLQGKVYCKFVVDEEGNIENIQIVKGIGGGCDEEALRVLRIMPKWKPGLQNGKAVRVQFSLPVSFVLR